MGKISLRPILWGLATFHVILPEQGQKTYFSCLSQPYIFNEIVKGKNISSIDHFNESLNMAKSTITLTQTTKFFTEISARTVNILFHVAIMIEPISLIVRYVLL